jgi:hypothetical protein
MAVLVLTSSVGLTVQQHTCAMSGQTQRAVVLTPHHACAPQQAVEAGCAKPQLGTADATVKDACCAFSAEHHKVDAPSHLDLVKVKVPALVAVLPEAGWQPHLSTAARLVPALVHHGSNSSPPPRAGRTLLAFVCTLVVLAPAACKG